VAAAENAATWRHSIKAALPRRHQQRRQATSKARCSSNGVKRQRAQHIISQQAAALLISYQAALFVSSKPGFGAAYRIAARQRKSAYR